MTTSIIISDGNDDVQIILKSWEEMDGYIQITASEIEEGEDILIGTLPTMNKEMWEKFKRAGDVVFELEGV
jgi:hypothetical protein